MAPNASAFAATARRLSLPAVAAIIALAAGCSQSNFGSELAEKPKPRDIDLPARPINLPQDQPFSIALAPTTKSPALGGSADATAKAEKSGSAEALADVKNGGTANATFQLGHAFRNTSDRQIDLKCRVLLHYEAHAEAGGPAGAPYATVGLRLYARDRRNRLLADTSVIDQTTERGAVARDADETLNVTLTLGPGDAVDLFLAGQAVVDIKSEHSGSAEMRIRDVRMEITPQPAPPVTATRPRD